jgi:hypothetical protein
MARDKDDDQPKFHGGTLGDRFADAGHAERPSPMPLQGGRHGKKPGCSLFALALLAAVGGVIALGVGFDSMATVLTFGMYSVVPMLAGARP